MTDAHTRDRLAFESTYKHLDLTEDKDAWGRPKYVHSHCHALWEGWQRGRDALRSSASRAAGQRYRHKKRGSTYEVIGRGKVQCDWLGQDNASADMSDVVIYRSESDGTLWVRPVGDFDDGRFEAIASLPRVAAPDGRCDYCKEHGFQHPNLCEDCRDSAVESGKDGLVLPDRGPDWTPTNPAIAAMCSKPGPSDSASAAAEFPEIEHPYQPEQAAWERNHLRQQLKAFGPQCVVQTLLTYAMGAPKQGSYAGSLWAIAEYLSAALAATVAEAAPADINPRGAALMADDQVKYMADRFLGWKLPEDFNPDGGISFKRTFNEHTAHPMKHEPIGTNLFDATQATAMVRHMVEGMPGSSTKAEAAPVATEPDLRCAVIRMLWEKQFEGSPWADKIHLMRPDSLARDYGPFADKLIAAVEKHIRDCFELVDKRRPPAPVAEVREAIEKVGMFFRVLRGPSYVSDAACLNVTNVDYRKAREGFEVIKTALTIGGAV